MAPRTDAQIEDYAYRLLPDYIRDDDPGTLATFLGKATDAAMGPSLRLVDVGDPDTSVTGTAELANPAAAPRTWLSWLAWLVGISLTGIPDAEFPVEQEGSPVGLLRTLFRQLVYPFTSLRRRA